MRRSGTPARLGAGDRSVDTVFPRRDGSFCKAILPPVKLSICVGGTATCEDGAADPVLSADRVPPCERHGRRDRPNDLGRMSGITESTHENGRSPFHPTRPIWGRWDPT